MEGSVYGSGSDPLGLAAAARKLMQGLKGADLTRVEVADDEQAPPTVRASPILQALSIRCQALPHRVPSAAPWYSMQCSACAT
jgi:hypothetical protein